MEAVLERLHADGFVDAKIVGRGSGAEVHVTGTYGELLFVSKPTVGFYVRAASDSDPECVCPDVDRVIAKIGNWRPTKSVSSAPSVRALPYRT
jgi:hypothetical protein